jgi:hypothetical protein
VAEGVQQVAQAAGVRTQRVVAARLGRLPVAEQVRGEHVAVLAELGHDGLPLVPAGGDAVDEQHDGPRTPVRSQPGAGLGAGDDLTVHRPQDRSTLAMAAGRYLRRVGQWRR